METQRFADIIATVEQGKPRSFVFSDLDLTEEQVDVYGRALVAATRQTPNSDKTPKMYTGFGSGLSLYDPGVASRDDPHHLDLYVNHTSHTLCPGLFSSNQLSTKTER